MRVEYTIGVDAETEQEAFSVALVRLVIAAVAYRDQVVERSPADGGRRSADGGVLTACVVKEANRGA